MFLGASFFVFISILEGIALENHNFILFLTDDQDILLNSMKSMKKTINLLGNDGIILENAFVNSPICCPSRSSILTGMYPHNVNVYNNSINGNCSSRYWQDNFEKHTIASILKEQKNYRTFYAGKYLNQYGSEHVGGVKHVPPGYDWWIGLKGNSKYYNYTLSLNGTGKFFEKSYLTDILANYSLDFINLNYNEKFFMMIAPPAAHSPFTPADRHSNEFPGEKTVKTPSFNHSSDEKHWIVTMDPKFLPSDISNLDEIQKKRLQTLLSVDEMIEKIVINLKKLRIYDKTYVIFTSDNGFHIGQFGQPWDKRQPYETDLRIPLIIKGPNLDKNKILSYPVSSVDIAPTILDLAGVAIPENMDGTSFKRKLSNPSNSDYNKFILIEYWGEGNEKSIDETCPIRRSNNLAECNRENWCKCEDSRNNTYVCLVQMDSMYVKTHLKICKFDDDLKFIEVYDLINDPFELHNIRYNFSETQLNFYENIMNELRNCKGTRCSSFEHLYDTNVRVEIVQ